MSVIITKHKRPTICALVATATAAVLLGGVAACGSSGGSSSGSSGAKATSTVRFGVLSPNANLAPVYVAAAEGFFKKAGLDVEITNFSGGGASSSAALASGAVDVASGGPGSFIGSIAKKAIHGKIFAQLMDQSYDLISAKGIDSVSDLKGKTIGISGGNSNDQIYLVALLKDKGISKDDVTFLNTGNPSNRYAALAAGKIDATAQSSSTRSVSENTGTVLVKAESSPIRNPGQVFYVDQNYLDKNKATLKSFMKVVYSTVDWIKNNQDKAAAACAKESGAPVATCTEVIKFSLDKSIAGKYTWSSTFALDPVGIEQTIKATAILIPEAAKLKVSDVMDTSITGKTP